MRIAIFDISKENQSKVRNWLHAYSRQYNTEFDVMWFSKPVIKDIARKYAMEIQLAYISLDNQWGLSTGKILYELNPDCRICYYSAAHCELYPLLCTRPIEFFCMNDGGDKFIEVHRCRVDEVINSGSVIVVDTRKQSYCISSHNVEYLQSNLKYVDFFIKDREPLHIYHKLTDIEPRLDGRFLRIHKSYIVNSQFVAGINKECHTVTLISGVSLPISNPYYKNTLSYFGII